MGCKFCAKCGTTVYYHLEVWGDLIGIDGGTLDPPTFFFDIAGEVFTKSKAHFVGDIRAAGHFETFPVMSLKFVKNNVSKAVNN